jgi:hypothetical protein
MLVFRTRDYQTICSESHANPGRHLQKCQIPGKFFAVRMQCRATDALVHLPICQTGSLYLGKRFPLAFICAEPLFGNMAHPVTPKRDVHEWRESHSSGFS